MFFAAQLDQRTISSKIVRQCRERISFTITEVPVKGHNRAVASPVSHRPAAKDTHRKRFTPLGMAIGAALLLVFGAGVYFTAPGWQARSRQWIHQLRQPQSEPSAMPVQTPRTDIHAAKPHEIPVEVVPPAIASDTSPITRIVDIPLRMPRRPPDIDSLEIPDVRVSPQATRNKNLLRLRRPRVSPPRSLRSLIRPTPWTGC